MKKTLLKIWVWLKHNWMAPFIVVYTLFLWVILRRQDEARAVLEIRSNSYKDQIDAINNAHKEELERRDKILEKYNKTIERLEEEFAKNNKELTDKKKESVKEIVEKYHDDPDTLAIMIGKRFGFKYTE
jgi:predicted secreted protein